MPAVDLEELGSLIAQGKITVITLDTSIFEQYQRNLRNNNLLSLKQFRNTNITVALSDVVIEELRDHMIREFVSATEDIRNNIGQYLRLVYRENHKEEVLKLLAADADFGKFTDHEITKFVKDVGVVRLPFGDSVSLEGLMARYFSKAPPFKNTKSKKNEFPDAVALLSLEAFLDKEDAFALAVSRDDDWASFAAKSSRIFCVKELPQALNLFHQESSVIAARLISRIREREHPEMIDDITRFVESYIEEFDVDADSDFLIESERDLAELIGWNIPPDVAVSVMEFADSEISISTLLEVRATFWATFRFFIRDSVDRDYVPVGEESLSTKDTIFIQVTMKIVRPYEADSELVSIAADQRWPTIEFGHVRPDWDDEI